MSNRLFGPLALTLGFALACSGGSTETPPPPPAAPPAPEAIAPPPPPSSTGDIGVPECDDYMKRMSACFGSMDAATKAAMESSFKQTTDAWRAAAATPEGKAGLAMGCKAALDSIPATCAAGAAGAAATQTGAAATAAGATAVAAGATAVAAGATGTTAAGGAAVVEVKTTEPEAAPASPDHKQGKSFTPRPGQGDDDDKDGKKKKKKKND